MGDEDWEAEIITPHLSSYVPVLEKVAAAESRSPPWPRGGGRWGGRAPGELGPPSRAFSAGSLRRARVRMV